MYSCVRMKSRPGAACRRLQDRLAIVAAGPSGRALVGRVLAKLGPRDRVQAVIFAYDLGADPPEPPRLSRFRPIPQR